MIQRYDIYTPVINDIKPDENGEWVRWEDIKHLMPIHEALMKCVDKTAERIIKGTTNIKPIGIMKDISNR